MAFQKGNTFGRGRPKISLQKPELLLPAVFGKAGVNWQNDFMKLYRALKEDRKLTDTEMRVYQFFKEFMPYLCTKVQLKEIDGKMASTPGDSASMAKATSKLLQALEQENASKPPTSSD